MEIRIDDAYEKTYIKENGDNAFWFYASFFALGINKDMTIEEQEEAVRQAYYNDEN